MVRTPRPPRGSRTTFWLGTAVLCLATSSCKNDDASLVAPETPPQPIELNVALSIPRFPGITLASTRTRVRTASGAIAVDTVAALTFAGTGGPTTSGAAPAPSRASEAEVTFAVLIPGELADETVTVSVDVMDIDGVTVYSSYDQALRDLGSRTAVVVLKFFYSGPGASARTLELSPTGNPAFPGDLIAVTAIVRDGEGDELHDVPVSWTLEGTDLTLERVAPVNGRAVAYVRGGGGKGAGTLVALLPTDLQNSVGLTVAPATASVPLSVRVPVLPGVQLSTAHVTLRRSGGQIAAEATFPVNTGDAAFTLGFTLEPVLERGGEVFRAEAEVMDEEGATWLATAEPVEAPGGTTATDVPLSYVGPGASVTTVGLEVVSTPAEPGSLVTVTAILRDLSGVEVAGVPVIWSVDGVIALVGTTIVDGRSTASFRAGNVEGTGRVTATLPSLVQGSAQITVRRPTKTLRLSFDVPSFPGIDLSTLGVSVEDMEGHAVAERQLSPPRSGTVDLEIPGSVTGPTVRVFAEARDAEGTLYYATPDGVLAGLGGVNPVALVYVGPGAEAESVTVQVSGTPVVAGGLVTARAVILDSEGAAIADVPVSWTLTEGAMTIEGVDRVDGDAEASIRTGSVSGQVRAAIPTGLRGEASIEVAEGESPDLEWRIITKSFPSLPQVQLTRLAIQVWHEDGALALDTVIPWESSSSAIPIVPRFEDEQLTVLGWVLDADDTVWLAMDGAVPMAPDPEPTELLLSYVGPGASAVSVVISPELPTTIGPGDEVVLEARAYDAADVLIAGAPFRWSAGAGLTLDEVWMDPLGVSKARLIATGEGDIEVTAQTVLGVSATKVVSVEPVSTLGVTIDFETFPDGSRTCVECPISTQYASLGVRFRFTDARASGGWGYPTTYRGFRETDTKLANDHQNQAYGAYLTGTIVMEFPTGTSEVGFDVWSTTSPASLLVAYDESGAIIDDVVVTLESDPAQGGLWMTLGHVTVSSARAIGRVDVRSPGGLTHIDNLSF